MNVSMVELTSQAKTSEDPLSEDDIGEINDAYQLYIPRQFDLSVSLGLQSSSTQGQKIVSWVKRSRCHHGAFTSFPLPSTRKATHV